LRLPNAYLSSSPAMGLVAAAVVENVALAWRGNTCQSRCMCSDIPGEFQSAPRSQWQGHQRGTHPTHLILVVARSASCGASCCHDEADQVVAVQRRQVAAERHAHVHVCQGALVVRDHARSDCALLMGGGVRRQAAHDAPPALPKPVSCMRFRPQVRTSHQSPSSKAGRPCCLPAREPNPNLTFSPPS
jgi:hypothetical protein